MRVTEADVAKAIRDKKITFKESGERKGEKICCIGEYWFYCLEVEKSKSGYNTEELARIIAWCINYPEHSGLGDAESDYYACCIKETA